MICTKSEQICDIVQDMDFDALVITDTWLSHNISVPNIVGDVTPGEYPFQRERECVSILLHSCLKCETHLYSLAISSKLLTDFCIVYRIISCSCYLPFTPK